MRPAATHEARRVWHAEELQAHVLKHPDSAIRIPLTDGSAAEGVISRLQVETGTVFYVAGRLHSPEPGTFFLQRQRVPGVAGDFVGILEFPGSGRAFRLEPGSGGGTELVARDLGEVKCIGMPPPGKSPGERQAALKPNPEAGSVPQTPDYQGGIPALESLPGSTPVIYLDFDGESTTTWGGIDAAPSGMSFSAISDCWRRVAADYLPYNINVTTDRRVFDNAPEGRRQMTVFTPTDDAAPGAGGVSYIGSFNWSGNTPNWVYVLDGNNGGEAASHENGHALGLGHDGQTNDVEYYGGHGSGELDWAPIMGVGYGANVSQWSKGEYNMANNRQDDLSIIDGNNSVAYRNDEHGSNFLGASWMELFAGNRVTNEGIIARNTDIDAFRFATTGGAVDLTVSTVMAEKQIAYDADLCDTNTAVLYSFTSGTSLAVRVVLTNLSAGDYCLRIRGAGRGNTNSGFTSYASLGYYRLTGTVGGGVQPLRFNVAENSTNGTIVGTITNGSPSDPHVYVITAGNSGTAFAVSSSGVLSVAASAQLNYEAREWLDLFVAISNTANPALDEPPRRIVVQILNSNETPVFAAAGPFAVFEGTAAGTEIGSVSASDADQYTRLRYSIGGGNSNNTFGIDPDWGTIYVNATVARPANTNFNLLVRAVDSMGAGARTGTLNLAVNVLSNLAPTASGGAAYAFFGGIGSGTAVANLTTNSRWPSDPTFVTILPSAEAPEGQAESFGAVLRAWLQVPFSGNYQFAIASDDGGELRLSTNGNPAAAAVIASVSGWTNPREWTKFTSQKSALYNLQAGQLYYLEARMKEGSGNDNLAVAWSNSTLGVSDLTVIDGQYLAPYFIDPLPDPLVSRDIGAVGAPGLVSYYGGTFAISGSGTDLWGTNDQFQFSSLPVSGDFVLAARVTAQNASHPYAKSGVMIRDSILDSSSCFAVLATPSNGVRLQYRLTNGGSTVSIAGPTSALPVWVRATRIGNSFRAYTSTNNETWTPVGTAQTIVMVNPVEAGLCVTAHDNAATNLSKFSHLCVLPPAWQARDLGAVGRPGGIWMDTVASRWHTYGGGTDVWGSADQCHFAHQDLGGDVSVVTRVVTQSLSAAGAKAGLMLRDGVSSNAAFVNLFVQPSNGARRIQMTARSATGAAATLIATATNLVAPYWLRLDRSATNLTGMISPDGTNWTTLGTTRIGLPPLVQGGLFVTAGTATNLGYAAFEAFSAVLSERNFVWTNGLGGAWSEAPGWTNDAPPLMGGSVDYRIVVAAVSNAVLTNDLGSSTNGGFLLNQLVITQSVVHLSGSNLLFRSASTGTAASLWNTTTGSVIGMLLQLDGVVTFNGNSGQTLSLTNTVEGTGMLAKAGSSTLILLASNRYGSTVVSAGTLQLGGQATFGTAMVSNNGTLVFARTGSYVVANGIAGSGGLNKTVDNNGILTLAGTNAFTGGITVSAGGLLIRHAAALGVGTKSLTMTAGSAGNAHLRLDGSGGSIVIGTNISFFASNASGSLYNASGTNVVQGHFTLTSGGGNTVLLVQTGRLHCAGNFAPNTTGRGLDLRGNGDGEISGVISDGGQSTALVVRKDAGTGTWILSGSNTYGGPTAVSAGTLVIDGSLSTGAVTVAAGSSLGGTGTLSGPVSAGGIVRPGSSQPGVMNLEHSLLLQATARLQIDLAGTSAATGFGSVTCAGPVTLGGLLDLRFTNGSENALATGTSMEILRAASVTGSFANATNGALLYAGLGRFTVGISATNVVVTYQALRTSFTNWQAAMFGCTNCPQAAASSDPDGDGMSNWDEYLSGSSPTNSRSLLRLVSLEVTNNDLLVKWQAVSNALYQVESGNLTNQVLPTVGSVSTPGSGVTTGSFLQPGGASGASNRIFRIRLLAP